MATAPIGGPEAHGPKNPARWQELRDAFREFTWHRSVTIGDRVYEYPMAMELLGNRAAYHPNPQARHYCALLAAGLAGMCVIDFVERTYNTAHGEHTTEMPSGRDAERLTIMTAALATLLGDEIFLAVAQAVLGFGGSMQERDLLADCLSPLSWKSGDYVIDGNSRVLDDVLAAPDPADRLRALAHDRFTRQTITKQQRLGGGPTFSIEAHTFETEDGELTVELPAMEVVGERAVEFTTEDWEAIDVQLRASGKRSDERTARALSAYREARGSKAAMGASDYMYLRRQFAKPSRLAWLIRQRAATMEDATLMPRNLGAVALPKAVSSPQPRPRFRSGGWGAALPVTPEWLIAHSYRVFGVKKH